jgi:hypothetical protein
VRELCSRPFSQLSAASTRAAEESLFDLFFSASSQLPLRLRVIFFPLLAFLSNAYGTLTIVVHDNKFDSVPSFIRATTEIICLPGLNTSGSVVAVIPFINPFACSGTGTVPSFVGLSIPTEMSYNTNSCTHRVFIFFVHAGVP